MVVFEGISPDLTQNVELRRRGEGNPTEDTLKKVERKLGL